MREQMAIMHAEAKRKDSVISTLQTNHSQAMEQKDDVIKKLKKHNMDDRKAVNNVSTQQCSWYALHLSSLTSLLFCMCFILAFAI